MRAILFDGFEVDVDARAAAVGGSFYYDPLRSYGPVPVRWAFQHLQDYTAPIMLDIGASTGCFALLAAHLPNLRVFAFEPVSAIADILEANVALNNLQDRVTVVRCAVSNYNGYGTMHEVTDIGGSGCSMLDGTPYQGKETRDYEVPVTTVDQFCKDHAIQPTMIKVDVEGGEKQVLLGAKKTLGKNVPLLIVEYEPINTAQYGYRPFRLRQMLEARGYYCDNLEGLDLLCQLRGFGPT